MGSQVRVAVKGFGRPWQWGIGVGAAALIGAGAIAITLAARRQPSYDLEALTVPVESAALTVRIQTNGVVEPIQTVNLSPRTAGIVERLYVEQGDRVVPGQIIAEMRSADLQAQLRQNDAAVQEAAARLAEVERGALSSTIAQAQAGVTQAQAQAQDAQARLDLAREQLARTQQLQAQGAIAASELDVAQGEVNRAEAGLRQAQARIREAQQRVQELRSGPTPEAIAQVEARLAQVQAQRQATQVLLEETQIRAPFGGVITQRFAVEGAFVTPTTAASTAATATSTAIVALASGLEVVAEVPEADIRQIRPGQRVEIQADALPDQTFQGQVRLIAPEAILRQNVTLFQVRITLVTGADELLSNLNVRVDFIGDTLADALVVPTVAVVTQGGRTGVLVPGSGDRPLEFRPVTLGSQVADRIQILAGVTAGERVFIDLPPGQNLEDLTAEP